MYIKAKARGMFSDIKQPIGAVFLCLLFSRYAVYVVLPLLSSRIHHIDCILCSDSSGCKIIYLPEGMTLQDCNRRETNFFVLYPDALLVLVTS
jgi:hypothetical protein